MLQLGPGSQGWILGPWQRRSSRQKQWWNVLMIWRPCRWDIEVGPDLFESLSNNLSIKSSWTSIALQMTKLWCSWFIISLPTNQKFNFIFVPTIKDWHVQVEPSELYQKSLCKYRNELTLYLTIMVISIGVMSSSHSHRPRTSCKFPRLEVFAFEPYLENNPQIS